MPLDPKEDKPRDQQKPTQDGRLPGVPPNYEDDPLIRLIGSGKHIWADEHADEYVENLRREDF
ncbi:MAG: hypothetical protein ACLGSD_08820 [Acidobacteriota bacterium]